MEPKDGATTHSCKSMTTQMPTKFVFLTIFAFIVALASSSTGHSQQHRPLPASLPAAKSEPIPAPSQTAAPHRTRLILKDGSYQIVMSYRVAGNVVHYISAERGGADEEIPTTLVDLDATHLWEARHTTTPDGQASAPVLDPELLKEESDRAALTPEVAPDLRLPTEDSVLALDTFRGTPELVPLPQSDGDLNHNTAHNILRASINPLSSSHQIVQLKGEKSFIQLHIDTPVLYLRVGDATAPPSSSALVVDTHGATGQAPTAPVGGSSTSKYVIVRADVRTGLRILASFKINLLGGVKRQEDVVETTTELLPGGHWMKITPRQPLEFGEFALMEVISEKEINLGVWDFGVHPIAPENRDAQKPQPRRPVTLERRRPN
jgi:hypothetical protein